MSDPRVIDVREIDDVPARLAFALGRLNRLLRPTHPVLSHGLLLALSTIVRCGPLRPGELCRIEGLSAPSTTRLIVDLESRGLVARVSDPADGRSFFVEGTESGRLAIVEARQERAVHASELMVALTDEERATIVDALPALEKAAGLAAT